MRKKRRLLMNPLNECSTLSLGTIPMVRRLFFAYLISARCSLINSS